jgi:hypothetical protein
LTDWGLDNWGLLNNWWLLDDWGRLDGWGLLGAHPTTSNIPAMISDRNFTLPSLAPLTPCARRRYRCGRFYGVPFMMIDDDTLKKLLRIEDELMQLCKWLNEKQDMETSSRLIPLVDDLTHILIEAGKNKLH